MNSFKEAKNPMNQAQKAIAHEVDNLVPELYTVSDYLFTHPESAYQFLVSCGRCGRRTQTVL
jgi:hypothetical protein